MKTIAKTIIYVFSCLVVFLATSLAAHGQKTGQARLDSLIAELPKCPDDTSKVKLYFKIAYGYYTINSDEGIKYGEKQLDLAEHLDWKKGIISANVAIAINYMSKGDYPKALEYEFVALKKAEELKDKDYTEVALENIGINYRMQHDYPKALNYLLKALKLCEELGNKKKLENVMGNVGDTYWASKQYDKAEEFELKALALSESIGDKSNMAKNLGNIGNIYQDQLMYAQALPYDLKAVKIYESINDKYGLARNLGNIGAIYIDMVLPSTHVTTPPDSLIPASKQERVKLGLSYLKRSEALCREINYQDALISFTKTLSQAYEQLGDYQTALKYSVDHYEMKDSIFSSANAQKIKEIENKQALEIKEKDIQLARLEVARKRDERKFYLGGIALLLVVTGIVMRNYRKQKLVNGLLENEKVKSDGLMLSLRESLKQKETLMKEIHHRVKNNLQVISNLLELQGQGMDDKIAKDAIAEGQSRVRSIALIHHKLYQDDDISTLDFSVFLNELYTQVAQVFLLHDQELKANIDIPQTFLDIDTAVPLGLIVNELLTNAFKYAFKSGEQGHLSITLTNTSDYYVLRIQDNGPGLPAGKDLKSFDSLGIRLVTLLSKQIGGRTEYTYQDGSLFTIYFKNLDARKQIM